MLRHLENKRNSFNKDTHPAEKLKGNNIEIYKPNIQFRSQDKTQRLICRVNGSYNKIGCNLRLLIIVKSMELSNGILVIFSSPELKA